MTRKGKSDGAVHLLTSYLELGTLTSAKRKLEFEGYSQVMDEVGSADIHGVVTSLSPIKSPKKATIITMDKCVMERRACVLLVSALATKRCSTSFWRKENPLKFVIAR